MTLLEKLLKWRMKSPREAERRLFLVKDSNDLISWCECENAFAGSPGQMDCPWCGCGWLFSCTRCRKAFTFARAVSVEKSLVSLGREDLEGFGGDFGEEDINEWVNAMSEMLQPVEEGRRYVYLDGFFVPVDASPVHIDGWHSSHRLEEVPQVAALKDGSVIDSLLANPEYWMQNAIAREE